MYLLINCTALLTAVIISGWRGYKIGAGDTTRIGAKPQHLE